MSLNSRRGRVSTAPRLSVPAVVRLCPDCGLAVTIETLTRSTRFVVPCFRCPALNKLAGDQCLCFSCYLLIANQLQLFSIIDSRAKSHVFS